MLQRDTDIETQLAGSGWRQVLDASAQILVLTQKTVCPSVDHECLWALILPHL